jgi:beta-glucosidase-like glycosyl hydrolase
MASFNSINGVPSAANGPLINGVLRKQWGADFFAVSDYDGWANLVHGARFSTEIYTRECHCVSRLCSA